MSRPLYPYRVTAKGKRYENGDELEESPAETFRMTKLVMAEDADAAIYVMECHLKKLEKESDNYTWHYIDEWEVEEPLIQDQYDDGSEYD